MEEKSIDELKKEVEDLKKQRDEYLAGWQRARADLLNYKKEEIERMNKMVEYAREDVLEKLLKVIDNLEIAESKVSQDLKENEYVKGLLNVGMQLQDFLKTHGVEEVEATGSQFNPSLHEAVREIEQEGAESGTVVEVIQKGYTCNGMLIRPAKVTIAK